MSIDDKITYILPCHFGLESVAKRELISLGFEIKEVKDGEIHIYGKLDDIPKLNINIRTCERVLIEISSFNAETFDELYEKANKIEVEKYILKDDKFDISKANSDKKSQLNSQRKIQAIVKKAMADHLLKYYNTDNLPETNHTLKFRVKFLKNNCSIRLDTTGVSLHKRGYRIKPSDAPLKETLAAAIIMLTPFKKNRILLDPFCGSGTFCIEAALLVANIAPGLNRTFLFQEYDHLLDKKCWADEFQKAKSKIDKEFLKEKNITIYGSDINSKMINIAQYNAKIAGVLNIINFDTKAVDKVENNNKHGFIITNPPYGERIGNNNNLRNIYKELLNLYNQLDSWSMSVITAYDEAKKIFSNAKKNRKIYNGMLKTYLYQLEGEYK